MTTATPTGRSEEPGREQFRSALTTAAAKNLAATTKTVPQMQGISSRWLLRMLPWVEVKGGTYRVNRRLVHVVGDGRVTFVQEGARVRVVPAELGELPLLRGFEDAGVLQALAERCVQQEYEPGQALAEAGAPLDRVLLIAHGKVEKTTTGKYGEEARAGMVADGGFLGDRAVSGDPGEWEFTARAVTACTVLELPRQAYEEVAGRSEELRAHVERRQAEAGQPHNDSGEAEVALASGHEGEPALPATYVDYELQPREYELSVAQTVLRVHTRVADLYNDPMNQVEQQLRLTIEALRERQEYDLVNNREFGLLHNADHGQRISTRSGPPTPDDFDELLSMRRETKVLFAHPKAITAFGRECNRRGIYFDSADLNGHSVPAWRGVPILPCGKLRVSAQGTTSILAMRLGEDAEGVVGLRQTGIPDEYEPGLNVRFMGIDEKAVTSYLVSTYYSAAPLVPDALGVLENVETGRVDS